MRRLFFSLLAVLWCSLALAAWAPFMATSTGGGSGTPPSNTGLPTIVSSSPVVGTPETITTGTWSGTPTITFTCQVNWADVPTTIPGATSCSSYTPVSGDVGHTLSVTVNATNSYGGPIAATSTATSAVTNPAGFTPAWANLGLGSGGYVTDIEAYPDGTMLVRTDTNGFFLWNSGTSTWSQLMLATTLPAGYSTTTTSAMIADCAGSGCIAGSGIAACDFPTSASAATVGNTSVLYAVWDAEIFRSTNKGGAWTDTGQAVSGANGNNGTQKVNAPYVACDPNNTSVAYVFTPSGKPLYTSNGSTFTSLSAVATTTSNQGELFAFDPTSAVTGGFTQGMALSVYGTGVYVSSNGGAAGGGSYTLTSGGPTAVTSLKYDKFGTLWAATSASLFKYTGGSWSTVYSPAQGICDFAPDPSSTSSGALKITASACAGDTSYSTNGGSTWTGYSFNMHQTNGPIPWINVGCFQTSCSGSGGFTSSTYLNLGKSAFDTSGNFWMTGGTGVWFSAAPFTTSGSSGPTFTDKSAGIEQLVVQHMESIPGGGLLSCMWDRGNMLSNPPGAYVTVQYTNKIDIAGGWDCDWAASSAKTTLADVTSNIGHGNAPGLSADGGNTYTGFGGNPSGLSYFGMVTGVSATDICGVWAVNGALICSQNGGSTWGSASLPGTPAADWLTQQFVSRHVLSRDTVNNEYIAYDQSVGVFTSSGGSAGTWTKALTGNIDTGPTSQIYSATLESVPWFAQNAVYTAGLQSGGSHPFNQSFFKTVNFGTSWSAVSLAKEIRAFGWGAPLPGSDGYPTLYAAGWYNGAYGVYQVTNLDATPTWTSLGTFPAGNLDQVTTVAGDLNVAGRVYVGFRSSGGAYYDSSSACPWVGWTSIKPGTTVSGTMNLQATWSGTSGANPAATTVGFYVDGTLIGNQTTSVGGVFTQSWNTSGVSAGAHVMTVAATGNGCSPSTLNGTISGSTLMVNSGTAPVIGQMLGYAGMPGGLPPIVVSGSGSTWTLNESPGNVSSVAMIASNAQFSIPVTK